MTIVLYNLSLILLMCGLVYWIWFFISTCKAHENKKEEYKEKIYELEHKILRNKEDIIILTKENVELNNQIDDLNNQIESLNEELKKLAVKLEESQETIELLTSCQSCDKKGACLNL